MSWVQSFTHLKDRPHGDRALAMLERVASLVKPIMRAKGWVLPVLSEFFPTNPGLLGMNVNSGQKILLRLRPHHSPDTFYEEEDVIGTMLHELTHNVHGPHDEKFYKYLSELENEYYALRAKGYSGEGFHSNGKRVGQGVSHNVPLGQAKSKAILAAEQRQKMSGIMGASGGRRLGGVARAQAKSPRELAAEAAERRTRDEKTCGSTHDDVIERETQMAEEQSILDIPDIDVPPSPPSASTSLPLKRPPPSPERADSLPVKRRTMETIGSTSLAGSSHAPPRRAMTTAQEPQKSTSVVTSRAKPLKSKSRDWTCSICTLINNPLSLQCDACGGTKPVDRIVGWTCLECGEPGNQVEWWTCMRCGRMKSEAAGG